MILKVSQGTFKKHFKSKLMLPVNSYLEWSNFKKCLKDVHNGYNVRNIEYLKR